MSKKESDTLKIKKGRLTTTLISLTFHCELSLTKKRADFFHLLLLSGSQSKVGGLSESSSFRSEIGRFV